ncbi:hypothetical protein [Comamonas sp. JC664]|uniref:hypothetical protein n=1 Tax=Comamonas sp. JC664 TaxID=2801917 RepID=UPI001749823F|nr:hypothetical protein [Comamonas sp. JC664]MBL0697379.1 hypothetical protein [Comamonas sp. JC664]GHG67384.1 hypothetical protein GCM10012319_09670 [Comamonas sp. KCTC 72670]
MRSVVYAAVMLAGLMTGCATTQGSTFNDLFIPDGEAIYERPLEELWPEVRTFFTENNLPFREDRGSLVLETEWRQEFGGSRVAGFFHRYMVLGKRESPTQSKLWIIRITKSVNNALRAPGSELDWGVSRVSQGGGGDDVGVAGLSVEDFGAYQGAPVGENSFIAGSGQGSRDLVMEWRVFRFVSPKLMKEENAPQPVKVAMALNAKAPAGVMDFECGLPILGLGKQVKPGAVLLLGEMHGTQEVPRFMAQAACQTAVAGTPVTVGLELPLENQTRIDAFLDSAGEEHDWLKLMEAPFWRSPYPDGRSSEAVANMLEQLRELRFRGLDVDIFVFDHPKAQGQAREDAMHATVRHQVESSPKRFHVILSGNIHSRTKKGLPWNKDFKPMGLLLKDSLGSVVSLDMAYNSGSAWICAVDSQGVKDSLDCGVREAKGRDNGDRFFLHTWGGTNGDGYHGVFYVGPVTASVPAVQKGLGRPGANDNSAAPVEAQPAEVATP